MESTKMGAKRHLPTHLLFYFVLLVLLVSVLAAPMPRGSRKSSNSCMGCHSNQYEMYVDIVSYSVPSFFNEDSRIIQCNVSITGNNASKASQWWRYYDSNLTVTATTVNGRLSIQGSPASFILIHPIFNVTVNFTVRGIGNGSETIKLEARLVPWHNPNPSMFNTIRSDIVNVPTQVQLNFPPILSDGKVTPASGSIKMTYFYQVTYIDASGDIPSFVNCTIDGTNYTMTPKDGTLDNIITGEIFEHTVDGATLGIGTDHQFNFSAFDGKYIAVGDIGLHYGPNIEKFDSPPQCNFTYPLGGTLSGSLNITGTAVDLDPDEDIISVELSLENGTWLPVNGTATWYFALDLFLWPDAPLSMRARSFNGNNYSSFAEISIVVDNSFSNTPPTLAFELANDTVVGPLVWINGTVIDPELPKQQITVLIGFNPIPNLQVNLIQIDSQWQWSKQFNISDWEEGEFTVYAVAKDLYASSPIQELSLELDIPNIPPIITINEIPETLWGRFEFTGTFFDVDNDNLLPEWSLDNVTWEPVNVSGETWQFIINVSYLSEEVHPLYLRVDDGENLVFLNIDFTVKGPLNLPVILQTTPESPKEILVREEINFVVVYRAQDHRGTEVEWFFNYEPMIALDENNITELYYLFEAPGEYEIRVEIWNAENESLKVTEAWNVMVKSILKIEPHSETKIESLVGEAIILQFGEVEGKIKTLAWTVDGERVTGYNYISFIPETPGDHSINVTVTDDYGNTASIEYIVTAVEPITNLGNEGNNTPTTEDKDRTVNNIVINSVGILLIVIVIFAFIMVFLAIRKSRKKQISVQPDAQTQPMVQPQTQPIIQPVTQSSMQPLVPQGAQPMANQITQPISQPITQPFAQPTAQPITQQFVQPTAQPVTQPFAQPMVQPVTQPFAQQFAQPVTQPITQPMAQLPSDQPAQTVYTSFPAQQASYLSPPQAGTQLAAPAYTTPSLPPAQEIAQPVTYQQPAQTVPNEVIPQETIIEPIPNNLTNQPITCPYCNQWANFYPEHNLYWCETCQQFLQT